MMRIETARLALREFVEEDWRAVLAYQSDPRYLRYYIWEGRTEAEVRAFVGMFLGHQAARPRTKFQLAIETKADGRLIGNCGVRLPASGARIAEIGYELNPDEWGRGYATEAARAMLDFGFTEFALQRAWANCVVENTASARVLARLGMRRAPLLHTRQYFKRAYPHEQLTEEELVFTWEDWMITRARWQQLRTARS
jgi:ribosomal-protein-alanine N-acetyltransferase